MKKRAVPRNHVSRGILVDGNVRMSSHYKRQVLDIFTGPENSGHWIFVENIEDGMNKSSQFKRELLRPFGQWLRERHGLSWFLEEMSVRGINQKLDRGQIIAINGLLAQEKGFEALQSEFRLRKKNTEVFRNSSGSFFTGVQEVMDKDMREFLETVFQSIGEQSASENATFERINGYRLSWFDKHSYPFHTIAGASLEEDLIVLPGIWDENSGVFTAFGNRSNILGEEDPASGLWVRNVLDDVLDSIDYAGDYVYLSEPVRNAAKLIWDAEFSREIETRFGTQALKILQLGLWAISMTADPTSWLDKSMLAYWRKGTLLRSASGTHARRPLFG